MQCHLLAPRVEPVWNVVPNHSPHVLWPCGGCSHKQPFASTECFRVNAQGRRVDVWLIYQCVQCRHTKNLSIHRRVLPSEISAERFAQFQRNHAALAVDFAWDVSRIRAADGAIVMPSWQVDGPGLEELAQWGWPSVSIEVHRPLQVRLDALVSRGLGLSRSAVQRLVRRGDVQAVPDRRGVWRRSVRHGQTIQFTGDLG